MKYKHLSAVALMLFLFVNAASAQKAEVTISLNEAFFDALLDSMFQNFDPPQFSIARAERTGDGREDVLPQSFAMTNKRNISTFAPARRVACAETIKILRENTTVRTAVRFRDGKIFVPIAFSGDYSPPFIGCVAFSGSAEANVDLEFDQAEQRLIGRVHVFNVNLNGTGGLGGTVVAKMLQGNIDKKLNPIDIMHLDKLNFTVPVKDRGSLQLKPTGVRTDVTNGSLNVRVTLEFHKG